MKNLSRIMAIFCLLLSLCSCEDEANQSLDLPRTSANPHAISMEQALASLQDFMATPSVGITRAARDNRRIGDVYAVEYKQNILTRSSHVLNPDVENLVYVANFENEQGFAILAADDRIGEDVLALVDSGMLRPRIIKDPTLAQIDFERPIYKNYPLTGPGLYCDSTEQNEMFLNPNTINLYDEEANDTLVGNFGLDEEDTIIDWKGNIIDKGGEAFNPTESTLKFIVGLVYKYTIDNIESQLIDDHGSSSTNTRIVTTYSDWNCIDYVTPILWRYEKWGQGAPFNDLYPKRRKFVLVGKKQKAPAGCFPLAISKVMTHFKFPHLFSYNNYTIDWNSLHYTYFPYSIDEKNSAASLLKGISEGTHSIYFYQGTFTLPVCAINFMRNIGFNNVKRHNYTYSRITSSLKNGCPLIIWAMPNTQIRKSHAWNIDGFETRVRNIITKKYINGVLKEEIAKPDTSQMVHCDLGQYGLYNGYFTSGIFRLNGEDVELDNSNIVGKSHTNYNTYIRIITYNKPD